MTAYDYWKEHNLDFAAGVRLLNNAEALPKGITQRLMNNLNKVANHGGYVPEYEQGKLEIALKEMPWQAPVRISDLPAIQKVEATDQLVIKTSIRGGEGKRYEVTFESPLPKPPGIIALHKEHSHHHALMVAADTVEDRAEHAREIMERIIPTLDAYYDRQRNGTPEAESDPAAAYNFKYQVNGMASVVEINPTRKLHSIRTRISKLKKLIPDAPTLARKTQLEAELEDKLAEENRLSQLE